MFWELKYLSFAFVFLSGKINQKFAAGLMLILFFKSMEGKNLNI